MAWTPKPVPVGLPECGRIPHGARPCGILPHSGNHANTESESIRQQYRGRPRSQGWVSTRTEWPYRRAQELMRRRRNGAVRKEAVMALLLATREGLYRSNGAISVLGQPSDFLALARAPGDPGVYYAAATGGRVFRSRDGALSWEAAGAIGGFTGLSCLAVHP